MTPGGMKDFPRRLGIISIVSLTQLKCKLNFTPRKSRVRLFRIKEAASGFAKTSPFVPKLYCQTTLDQVSERGPRIALLFTNSNAKAKYRSETLTGFLCDKARSKCPHSCCVFSYNISSKSNTLLWLKNGSRDSLRLR